MTAAPTLRIIRDVTRELLRAPLRLTDRQVRFFQSPAFTRSTDWARLRYDFMRDHDGRCQCCGHGTADGRTVNVDHIHPRKSHPQFALTYANLQVLCAACNRGKGNRDRTDWRYRAPAIPTCPACRAPMQRRVGPHSPFWGCSRFPACRATRPENYLAAAAQPPPRQQRARSAVTTRREVLAHNRRRYARIVHKHRRARGGGA